MGIENSLVEFDRLDNQANFSSSQLIEKIGALINSEDFGSEESKQECRILIDKLLSNVEQELGTKLSSEVEEIYDRMEKEGVLARVEDLDRVINCLERGESIDVGNNDSHYANSVIAKPEGLHIALNEARAMMGPVQILVGLDLKALVGFKNDHVEVCDIDDNDFDLRESGLRKMLCRHIIGKIMPEDLRYLVIRIPRTFFPENRLHDSEKREESGFIFRAGEVKAERVSVANMEAKAA